MPKDPYDILGVSRTASAADIKKAYRTLAHQYHPDKKGGDEARFKEVNEAYQTLSNAKKKESYDRFGHAGAQGGFGAAGGQYSQDFGDFDMGNIFDMFGGFGGGARQARPEKGEDLHLAVQLTKKDLGKRKVYEFDAFQACDDCTASGVAKGSKRETCSQCQGQGRVRQAVRTPLGTFAQVVACDQCQGEGSVIKDRCRTCGGTGRTKARRTIEVHVPKDLPGQYLIAYPKQGNAGPQGTSPGDLTVTLQMK